MYAHKENGEPASSPASGPSSGTSGAREVIDRVGHVENVGVEFIPEDQRRGSPINIVWILFGGSMALSNVLIGWIPVSLGLGWRDAATAVVAGSFVGASLLAPMTLFGPRTGTNSPVASGAHFGASGRLIGSALGVLACLVFAALAVWTAGDVLAASAARLYGEAAPTFALQAAAYAVVSAVMIAIAVLGHANMVAMAKVLTPVTGALVLLGVVAFWPAFDPDYAGGDYAFGGFWPTWLAGMIVCAATINSYGPYTGDWTRHISRRRCSDRRLFAVTWLAAFFGMGATFLFGAYTATTFADPAADYAIALVAHAPAWYLGPLLFIALVAGTGQAVVNIYSMGLDFSAIVPQLGRVQNTVLLGGVAVALVYAGAIYEQLVALVVSFLAILVVLGAPWVVVNMVGFAQRRGWYFPQDLQVFNEGKVGGRYWFRDGLNRQGVGAWAAGALAGMLFVNTGWYVGPGARALGDADVGLFVSMAVAAVVYVAMLRLRPEPAYLFGPDGALFGMDAAATRFEPARSR